MKKKKQRIEISIEVLIDKPKKAVKITDVFKKKKQGDKKPHSKN